MRITPRQMTEEDVMDLFMKDKSFYRSLLSIALPIALQNLIIFGVSMADTVMIGVLGETELVAVAIANQLSFVFMLFTFGLASGANVMIAQYWGQRDIASIHKIVTLMYRLLLAGSLLFTVVALVFPGHFMRIFTDNLRVVALGERFLRVVGYSFLMMGAANSTVIMLRSVGTVRISLIVSLVSLLVNVTFNWIFIFGNLGVPALGVEGAAFATCIARACEIAIVLFYMLRLEKKIAYRPRYLLTRRLGVLGKFRENALPVLLNEILWGSGIAMVAVVIGRMGTEFTAAYNICQVLGQLVSIFIMGVGNASSVIIGNTVGAGEYERALRRAESLQVLSVGLGLVSSIAVLLLRNPLIRLYNITPLAKEYASDIMAILAVVVVFQSFAMTSLIGILRGGGDTRFVFLMDVLFLWMVSIPFGFLAGLYLQLPVPLVYAVIKSDEILKCYFAARRIRQKNWINDVTIKIS